MHELLDAAIEQIPAEALCRNPSSGAPAVAASYARVVVSEDLVVNGVLAKGTPLALSTWVGRTGLSEMPPCVVATDWDAWARRVRLDLARLRLYARAVYASTDAYVAALQEAAFNPVRGDGPGCMLSALLLTLSIRTGEIACLLALEYVGKQSRGADVDVVRIGHDHGPSPKCQQRRAGDPGARPRRRRCGPQER